MCLCVMHEVLGYNPCVDESEKNELLDGSNLSLRRKAAYVATGVACLTEQETKRDFQQKIYEGT